MLVLVKKASDDYWYQIRTVETIDDLFKIDKKNDLIVSRYNDYENWTGKELLYSWDGIKKEDIPLIKKADCIVTIYDDYVE